MLSLILVQEIFLLSEFSLTFGYSEQSILFCGVLTQCQKSGAFKLEKSKFSNSSHDCNYANLLIYVVHYAVGQYLFLYF